MAEIASQAGADKQCTKQEAIDEELRSSLFPEVLTLGQGVDLPGNQAQGDNLLPLLGNLEILGNADESQAGLPVPGAVKAEKKKEKESLSPVLDGLLSLQPVDLKVVPPPEKGLSLYTAQEFLAIKPENLPRNSHVLLGSESSSPFELNAQLRSLMEEYENKYGAKLDYAAEFTTTGAKLTVLVETAGELKAASLSLSADDSANDTAGNTVHQWPEQTEVLDCSTTQKNAFSSKMLGLDINSRPEAIQDERNRLLYKLPTDADYSRQVAIKKARAYGFDENLPTDVLKERFNATGARMWAKIFQMNTDMPSTQQIEDAQLAALEKARNGLTREEGAAASSKLWTSWFAQYAGLENYESYAPDVVKGFYSMKLQSQLAEDLGLDLGATEKEIYGYMERKAMQVDPRFSDEEVEHIRQARLLHLADDTPADVLAQKVKAAEAERLYMLNNCSSAKKDGGNPEPFQW